MTGPTRASYDRVAAAYAAQLATELTGKPLDRALLAAFAELARGPVLEVGGGPGHVAAHLSRVGVDVVHTDLSPAMCAVARTAGLRSVAADATALPLRDAVVGGVVCLYAVIHLDAAQRAAAYAELHRVLRPGGVALLSFHVRDADTPTGGERALGTWFEQPVDLVFRFLDPDEEARQLAAAGLEHVARLDRAPGPGEHASDRCSLLVRRPV